MYDIQWAASTVFDEEQQLDISSLMSSHAKAGFAGVEVSASWIQEEEKSIELRSLCYEHQIAPISALLYLDAIHSGWESDRIERGLVDNLDSLGAEYLVLSPSREQSRIHATESIAGYRMALLESIARKCSDIGLKATYQPSLEEWIDRSFMIALAERFPEEDLGFAPDLSLFNQAGADALTLMREWGPRCNYLSLSKRSTGWGVPLQELSRTLEEIQFSGWGVIRKIEDPARSYAEALQEIRVVFKI
ncbi:MAG: hypothetical protein KY468_19175 [Armatimonadetes bacterium]|nr:hypothetical protein [Armatimonadota bacterium]